MYKKNGDQTKRDLLSNAKIIINNTDNDVIEITTTTSTY